MNLLGSPNWISGVALCTGNAAGINRMIYGWYPYPDYPNTHCVVLFGHNPTPHASTPVYNAIRNAQAQGANLIVLDPRRSENAVREDMPEGVVRVPHGWWLPERAESEGTLSGAWDLADAQICPDDPVHLDCEQGVPHLKGIACRVQRAVEPLTGHSHA